ncbi:MAG: hypothetical protein Q4E35_00630, partial [Eubacteriales bacterium]|nr:hypothetical protein [Eubacteriales bacterium]
HRQREAGILPPQAANLIALFLPCPSAAIQGNIFLVPLKCIYPRYIVQYAVVPYNVGICYFGVIIDGEQDFFLVIGGSRREYFLAG